MCTTYRLREGAGGFNLIAACEELRQWLQGGQYQATLATLPGALPAPAAGALLFAHTMHWSQQVPCLQSSFVWSSQQPIPYNLVAVVIVATIPYKVIALVITSSHTLHPSCMVDNSAHCPAVL